MNRRTVKSALAAAFVAVLGAVGIISVTSDASAATNQQAFLTFYGWYDNTPPGDDTSSGGHAGGKGTFDDPITFAADTGAAKNGTKIFVPRVKKYFVKEDSCTECSQDWNGKGPNGGPKLRHYDLWLGGKGGNPFSAINCEDALTHYNADNTPVLEQVIMNPPSGLNDTTPIFNTGSGACYGGAKPNTSVGSYKNDSTSRCLSAPNNSTGTKLATSVCATGPTQTFTFQGAFMMMGNQCATISGSNITFTKCDGGPKQQWSVNPSDKTISDIQTSEKCFRASGNNLTAGSCSGTAAKWTFTGKVTQG